MVHWQITRAQGQLGPLSLAEVLAGAAPELDARGQGWIAPRANRADDEPLLARLRPWLDPGLSTWLILPHGERRRRDWWQTVLDDRVELGFGRAAVPLALSQLNRLEIPGRLLAAHVPAAEQRGLEAVIALDWTPADAGLHLDLARMDGRLDGQSDIGALINQGRAVLDNPEALFVPGTGSDAHLESLYPCLAHLGTWANPEVRWIFAEARLGPLGVAGSLYTWAWLESGYRLGDWAEPTVVLDLDDGPLVGLTVVSWRS